MSMKCVVKTLNNSQKKKNHKAKKKEIAWLIEKEDSETDSFPASTQEIKAAFSEDFDP